MKILNFGSLNYDNVYLVPHMVEAGETLSSTGYELFCGGKGLNQSIALTRAGVLVFHAGMIGEDGELLLQICKENGVDTRFMQEVPGRSGHTIIQVNEKGENCILLFAGANGCNTVQHIEKVLDYFEEGDYILLQNEINLLDQVISKAKEKRMKIVLNPSPFDQKLFACDLTAISLFIMNEIEGLQMTGEAEPEQILAVMEKKYPGAEVIITLGKDGCYCSRDGIRMSAASPTVKAVDTTAAGDTFTGYYLASVLRGMGQQEALEFACKAASFAVTKKGAIPSIPMECEVAAWKYIVGD